MFEVILTWDSLSATRGWGPTFPTSSTVALLPAVAAPQELILGSASADGACKITGYHHQEGAREAEAYRTSYNCLLSENFR